MKFSRFTNPELEEIKKDANFSEEEEIIFTLLAREKSIKEISYRMLMSTRTVDRKILSIKNKMNRIK